MNLFHCHAALASAALSLCITSNAAAQAWVQGHGGNPGSKYWLADTNGDGLDDAIELRNDNRSWTAIANGSHFESPTYTGLLDQSGEGMWGDVNGDGRDDYVRVEAANGRWRVESASSSGTFFFAEQTWITGHGIGSDRRCLDDVNGDGLADAVIYFAATGDWWVALSTGGSFASPTRWATGHGIGSHNQFLGDCNGDGRADSVIFQIQTGNWYVAESTTNGFAPATLWRSNHGIGSTVQWLEDATGDGRTDAVAYFDTTGDWWVAPASNSGTWFIVPTQYETGFGTGLNQRMGHVGHTTGADLVGIDGATGDWHVRVAWGHSFRIQGTTQPFGSGCLGSVGVPTLTASTLSSQRPVPGNTYRVRLTNVPAALRFGVIGFSTTTYAGTPLPADLGTLGAPGCQLRVSIDIVTTLFTPDWDLQLTNSSVLLGFILHQQVFQLDTGWNPLGMTLSNALRVQIGEF